MSGRVMSPQEPSLSLEQLVSALARKGMPLPFEVSTFLVLESCERLIGQPLTVTAAEVWLTDEGEVMVSGAQRADSERESARALVILLGELLVRSAPGVPQMLLDLVEHGANDEDLKLGGLRDALEASLVPLNRAATRRVLSRLLREARKDRERGTSIPAPDSERLDDELDALLGGTSKPRPKPAPAQPAQEAVRSPIPAAWRALEGDDEIVEHDAPRKRGAVRAPLDDRAGPRAREVEPEIDEEPATLQMRASDVQAGLRRKPRHLSDDLEAIPVDAAHSASSVWLTRIGVMFVVLALALGGAFLGLGRERAQKILGITQDASTAPPPAAAAPAEAEKPHYGELRVSSSPARAQVLLLIGRSPAVVQDLPVGIAHELVAVSDGRKVARDVVPSDASWTEDKGALQYELALQLAEGKPGAERELGPTRLPQSLGSATGTTGSVRVITSPPGAQVYQLIGFTPDVRVANLEVKAPAELLIYLSGYEPARVALTEASYKLTEGRLVADLDVALAPVR